MGWSGVERKGKGVGWNGLEWTEMEMGMEWSGMEWNGKERNVTEWSGMSHQNSRSLNFCQCRQASSTSVEPRMH